MAAESTPVSPDVQRFVDVLARKLDDDYRFRADLDAKLYAVRCCFDADLKQRACEELSQFILSSCLSPDAERPRQ